MFKIILQIDSTAIVNANDVLSQLTHTLLPNNTGGAIGNVIITIVGALLPIIVHYFKKKGKK